MFRNRVDPFLYAEFHDDNCFECPHELCGHKHKEFEGQIGENLWQCVKCHRKYELDPDVILTMEEARRDE